MGAATDDLDVVLAEGGVQVVIDVPGPRSCGEIPKVRFYRRSDYFVRRMPVSGLDSRENSFPVAIEVLQPFTRCVATLSLVRGGSIF